jgi:hypothetical protein
MSARNIPVSKAGLRGWGYEEIEWLLTQVADAGGAIPDKYFRQDDSPNQLEQFGAARSELGSEIS